MTFNRQAAQTAVVKVVTPFAWIAAIIGICMGISWISHTFEHGAYWMYITGGVLFFAMILYSEYCKAKYKIEHPPSTWDGR